MHTLEEDWKFLDDRKGPHRIQTFIYFEAQEVTFICSDLRLPCSILLYLEGGQSMCLLANVNISLDSLNCITMDW